MNGGGLDISLKETLIAVALLLGAGNSIGILSVDDGDRFTSTEAALLEAKVSALEMHMEEHDKKPYHGVVGVKLGELYEQMRSLRREHNWIQRKEENNNE